MSTEREDEQQTEQQAKKDARCRNCGGTFNLSDVHVTARYADCDVFKAPCCGASCDTRMRWGGPEWARTGYDDMRAYRRVEGEPYPTNGWRW